MVYQPINLKGFKMSKDNKNNNGKDNNNEEPVKDIYAELLAEYEAEEQAKKLVEKEAEGVETGKNFAKEQASRRLETKKSDDKFREETSAETVINGIEIKYDLIGGIRIVIDDIEVPVQMAFRKKLIGRKDFRAILDEVPLTKEDYYEMAKLDYIDSKVQPLFVEDLDTERTLTTLYSKLQYLQFKNNTSYGLQYVNGRLVVTGLECGTSLSVFDSGMNYIYPKDSKPSKISIQYVLGYDYDKPTIKYAGVKGSLKVVASDISKIDAHLPKLIKALNSGLYKMYPAINGFGNLGLKLMKLKNDPRAFEMDGIDDEISGLMNLRKRILKLKKK